MLYTSAEANKLLRSLRDQQATEKSKERENCTFQAANGEDIESVRPLYDFISANAAMKEIDRKIMVVKHAINVFNTKTVVTDGLTIDQVLIALPQLRDRKDVLASMRLTAPKARTRVFGLGTANVIDYTYANFDPADADREYKEVSAKIDRLQLALDRINATEKMEIDI